MKQALLLVDVQNDYFESGKSELFNTVKTLDNIWKILTKFRENNSTVIHIQHVNIRDEATFFLPNTEGVEINEKVAPLKSEHLIKKHFPNSFLNTNLADILRENKIDSVVICGMMSHICIDSTVRAAKEFGLEVILIEDACTTKDLTLNNFAIKAEVVHNVFMAALNGMFAKVMKTTEFL